LAVNPEYAYVRSLIASSSEMKELLNIQQRQAQKKSFTFGEAPRATTTPVLATTTKQWRAFSLSERNGEVYMAYEGDAENVPYYYCVVYRGARDTAEEYGQHVYDALLSEYGSTTDMDTLQGQRLCRDEIRIDRVGKQVHWFGFFPDSADIVLMHLDDGLYAVEVDDRAWQNTQLLYPGTDIHVVQDGGRIYVQDGEYYLEVFTEIASQ
jgi:hypothetical protein